jgi:hypothetical protein
VSSEAAKPKKAANKEAKKAAGAPYMKLESFCSVNETFETTNIRNLK